MVNKMKEVLNLGLLPVTVPEYSRFTTLTNVIPRAVEMLCFGAIFVVQFRRGFTLLFQCYNGNSFISRKSSLSIC